MDILAPDLAAAKVTRIHDAPPPRHGPRQSFSRNQTQAHVRPSPAIARNGYTLHQLTRLETTMDTAKVPVKLVKVTRVLGRTGTFALEAHRLRIHARGGRLGTS